MGGEVSDEFLFEHLDFLLRTRTEAFEEWAERRDDVTLEVH